MVECVGQDNLEYGVVVPIGVALVRHEQRELATLSGGDVGQGGFLGAVHTICADAYVGLLHLFRAVAQHVLAGFEPLCVFLALIGVIGLSAEEREHIAVASLIRRVLVNGEVGVRVAVGNHVVPLHGVLMDYAVDVTLLSPCFIAQFCDDSPVDKVLDGVCPGVVEYAAHIPGRFILMYFGGVLVDRVGVGRTAVNGEVFPSVPRLALVSLATLHGLHLVLLVIREHLFPTLNLVRTPLHAVHLVLQYFQRWNGEIVNIQLVIGVLVLTYPRDIDGFLSRVLVVQGSNRVGHLYQVRQTLVLPLRNHHVLQFVGGVVEQRLHFLTQ